MAGNASSSSAMTEAGKTQTRQVTFLQGKRDEQDNHTDRMKQKIESDTGREMITRRFATEDMEIPGFRLHLLKGSSHGRWSIWVNGNWRITFEFENGSAHVLDYEEYH